MFTDHQWEVINRCFQYSIARLQALPPRKLAYYTTSETALRIIQNKTFWLRNPRLMNDFQEVVHGTQCLRDALTSPEIASKADSTIHNIFPGLLLEIFERWETKKASYATTYAFIACLSEIDATDDRGVLSMWRAYGGSNGVAMILNSDMLTADTTFLNTYHSPVLYGDVNDIKSEISKILEGLYTIKNSTEVAGKEFVIERILLALEFAMLSIKHVGFAEEREWRMIHRWAGANPYLAYEGRVIRGNAEVVCEINLSSSPLISPDALFEKIIVGPCLFPENTAEAIRCAFANQSMNVPTIVMSDIPLRHM